MIENLLRYQAAYVAIAFGETDSAIIVVGVESKAEDGLRRADESRLGRLDVVPHFHVIDLQRFVNAPSYDVLQLAAELSQSPRLDYAERELIVDCTEYSETILDSIWDIDEIVPIPVALTGERTPRSEGGIEYIPRREIVSTMILALQEGVIHVSGELELASAMDASFADLSILVADELNSLTSATAFAVWYARRDHPRERGWGD